MKNHNCVLNRRVVIISLNLNKKTNYIKYCTIVESLKYYIHSEILQNKKQEK